MKIGIFDSGIGGLNVLHEALLVMPEQDYLYYADTKNVPYGTKPKDQVQQYIFEAADFLVSRGAEAIVIACNTATSVAIEALRERFDIPVLGMEPAVKPAVEICREKSSRVLVTATPLTLKEEKLKNLIQRVDAEDRVDVVALPGLVEFAESLCFEEQRITEYLVEALKPFDLNAYGTIVLGCTHFPYYKTVFEKLAGENTEVIDGSRGTVRHLRNRLMARSSYSEGTGQVEFYNSGVIAEFGSSLEKFELLMRRLNNKEHRA